MTPPVAKLRSKDAEDQVSSKDYFEEEDVAIPRISSPQRGKGKGRPIVRPDFAPELVPDFTLQAAKTKRIPYLEWQTSIFDTFC